MLKIASLIFWCFVIFDTGGRFDRFFSHEFLRIWVRNEAVLRGYYYPWEGMNSGIVEIRRVFVRLKESGGVPPDEVVRFLLDPRNDNFYYDAMCFNYKCQQSLMSVLGFGLRDSDYDLLEEFQRLHRIYDLLDDINRPRNVLWEKRIKCEQLRMMLGVREYENGNIPPCIPLESFRLID